jgi:hypothetical protein
MFSNFRSFSKCDLPLLMLYFNFKLSLDKAYLSLAANAKAAVRSSTSILKPLI